VYDYFKDSQHDSDSYEGEPEEKNLSEINHASVMPERFAISSKFNLSLKTNLRGLREMNVESSDGDEIETHVNIERRANERLINKSMKFMLTVSFFAPHQVHSNQSIQMLMLDI